MKRSRSAADARRLMKSTIGLPPTLMIRRAPHEMTHSLSESYGSADHARLELSTEKERIGDPLLPRTSFNSPNQLARAAG